MADNTQRRVVITGIGVVAPNGIGKEAFWQATSSGISGITPLRSQDTMHGAPVWVAGSVNDFVAERHFERKLARRADRMTHFVLAAIQEAIADAGLEIEQEDPHRVGAVIANTLGGVGYVLQQFETLYTRGPRFVSAYTAIAWLNVANVGHAAIRYGIQGYCKTPVNDTAGGLDALGMAYNAIRRGAADVIFAGGCEAFLYPFVLQVMAHQGLCAPGEDPRMYRPFDRRAAGLVLAEGAGMCILEEYERARRRGATIYGEVAGYGQSNDAHGLGIPSSNGARYASAMRQAMRQGDIAACDLAYFSPDGRAMPDPDHGEAEALHLVFGSDLERLPVSVPRTMLGHSYAAAGAIDAIIAALALTRGLIPPTINCEELDALYGLSMVREAPRLLCPSRTRRSAVLLGARGGGGVNVALAIKKGV